MSPRDVGNSSDVFKVSGRNRELSGIAFRSALEKGTKKAKAPQLRSFRLYCFHCHGFRVCDRDRICPKCGMICRL